MTIIEKYSLNDKVALVTGGAGLLGKEHSVALAQAGAKVIITDVNEESIQDAIRYCLSEYPEGRFHGYKLDVTNEDSIKNCLAYTVKEFSRFDILVNNAAIDPKVTKTSAQLEESRFENFDLDSWNFQINVGLTGAMLCSKHFGFYMSNNGGGVILNIASDLAVVAPDQRLYRKDHLTGELQPVKPVTYSAIKHGLLGLTKYLATYWADKNVRANSLSPGGVFNNQPEEFVQKIENLIPLGRMASRQEYRGAVQFLCSDASLYMTGQNIVMDGGRSVW